MAKTSSSKTPSLTELRREIDRIDEAMHGLLMERGEIIDRLIAVKQTQESGSAFRPAREADMMRRLVDRHKGILPLDTAESIWRVIIATFTYVQTPFSVHADLSAGDAHMRDSARFHFGFHGAVLAHMGAASVVAAVSSPRAIRLGAGRWSPGGSAWWNALEFDAAPNHRAAPVRRARRSSAAMLVFVISRGGRCHGERWRCERAGRRLERAARAKALARRPR
jgi:chorismate mutase